MSSGGVLRVGQYEVERHHIRWVEAELRRYPQRVQRIRILEQAIAQAGGRPDDGTPKGSTPGDPTFNRALAMMRDQELAHLRLVVRTVDDVLASLPADQRQVIETLYLDGRYTVTGAAEQLHMSPSAVWRLRNQALLAFVSALIGDQAIHTVA